MGLKIPKEKLTEALDKAIAGLRSNIQSAVDKAVIDVREKVQDAMDKTASNAIKSTKELQAVQKGLKAARKTVNAIEKPIKPLEELIKIIRKGILKLLKQLLKVFKILSWLYNMFPIQYVYGVLVDETKEQLSDQIDNLDYNLKLGEDQINYAKTQIRKLQDLLNSVSLSVATKEVVADLPADSDDRKKLQNMGIVEKPNKADGSSNRFGGRNIFEKLVEKQTSNSNNVLTILSDDLSDTLKSLGFSGDLQSELQSTYVQNQLLLAKPGSTINLRNDQAGSSLLDFYSESSTVPPGLTVNNSTYQTRKRGEILLDTDGEEKMWFTGIENTDPSKKYWKTTVVINGQGQYSRFLGNVESVSVDEVPKEQSVPESRLIPITVLTPEDLLDGESGILPILDKENIPEFVDKLVKLLGDSNLSDSTKDKLSSCFEGKYEGFPESDEDKIILSEKRTYRVPNSNIVLELTMHEDPNSSSVAVRHFTLATSPSGDKIAESSKSYTLDPDILFTELELILDRLYM